jgi:hypothetical protein
VSPAPRKQFVIVIDDDDEFADWIFLAEDAFDRSNQLSFSFERVGAYDHAHIEGTYRTR